jgi:integrase
MPESEEESVSLTLKKVARLIRAGKEGDFLDGPPSGVRGLYLCIKNPRNASWGLRFQLNKRTRWMGLGSALLGDGVTLDQAREKAKAARASLRDKLDPLVLRRQQRAAQAAAALGTITFEQAAKQWYAQSEPTWKNPKHAKQVITTLRTFAFPVIGNLSVADIDTPLVLRVLEPIWNKTPETASRLRGRIENVLAWATVRGYRKGDNPARWEAHLDQALPRRSGVAVVNHHAALDYRALPTFVQQLRQREGVAASALAFLILTAARTGEVLGAKWSEIDFNEKTWTVPGERMKAGKTHKVPLSDAAITLLQNLPRDATATDGYLFIGARAGAPLSHMATTRLMRRLKQDAVVHGFRSTFSTWAGEQTNFPQEVREACLAHAVASKVEAAYRRGSFFNKRRQLMEVWSRYCFAPPAAKTATNVIPMAGVR